MCGSVVYDLCMLIADTGEYPDRRNTALHILANVAGLESGSGLDSMVTSDALEVIVAILRAYCSRFEQGDVNKDDDDDAGHTALLAFVVLVSCGNRAVRNAVPIHHALHLLRIGAPRCMARFVKKQRRQRQTLTSKPGQHQRGGGSDGDDADLVTDLLAWLDNLVHVIAAEPDLVAQLALQLQEARLWTFFDAPSPSSPHCDCALQRSANALHARIVALSQPGQSNPAPTIPCAV